jgi:hypothetical protein
MLFPPWVAGLSLSGNLSFELVEARDEGQPALRQQLALNGRKTCQSFENADARAGADLTLGDLGLRVGGRS